MNTWRAGEGDATGLGCGPLASVCAHKSDCGLEQVSMMSCHQSGTLPHGPVASDEWTPTSVWLSVQSLHAAAWVKSNVLPSHTVVRVPSSCIAGLAKKRPLRSLPATGFETARPSGRIHDGGDGRGVPVGRPHLSANFPL